jgi:AraC family transcriptional regulator, L-rhamnose operon transcriptional activator RhaR
MPSAAAYFWGNHYPASDVVHVDLVVRNGKRVLHTHDYAEIALTVEGEGEFRSVHLSRIISKGSLVVVPPGVAHTYTNCRNAHILFCSIRPEIIESVSLSLNMKPSVWADVGLGRSEIEPRVCTWQIERGLVPLYAQTLAEMLDTHRHRGIRAQFARVGGLFAFLGMVVAQLRPHAGMEDRQDGVDLQALTVRALSFLRSDLTRPWTMAELCQCLNGVHPVHLCRVFKRDMKMTPMSYLRHLRCQHAAHLLATSDTPVGSIGSAVGWDDANLFSRRFRAICGVTPSAYRLQHGRH